MRNQAIHFLSTFSPFTCKRIGVTTSLTHSKRPYLSQFTPGFTLRASLSSPPPSPPGPPNDPIPTPPPGSTGVNSPVDTLPPPKKTGSSITFRV